MEGYLQILADAGVVVCNGEETGLHSLQTSCGIVLLHVAAISGSIEDIIHLLKLGFSIDVKSNDNFTPLCRAVSSGKSECVEFLIEKGADLHVKTSSGGTLLHLAASSGQEEIVEILLKHGLDIDAKDDDGLTPLYRAAEHDQFYAADCLIDKGADIYTDPDGTTLLHLAAARGCLIGIRCLLYLDFEIEMLNDFGYCAIYSAAKAGKVESIKELVASGADLFTRDKNGNSLLHIAAREGDEVAAKTLIEAGIGVDITGGWWSVTPLHVCADNGQLGVAKLLIEKAANMKVKTSDGRTPIDFALRNEDVFMISFLTSFENMISIK